MNYLHGMGVHNAYIYALTFDLPTSINAQLVLNIVDFQSSTIPPQTAMTSYYSRAASDDAIWALESCYNT